MTRFSSTSIALVLLLALASGCGRKGPEVSSEGQVFRISQRNEPENLDPAGAALPDDFFIIRALSEGLIVPAPGGYRAGAADSWSCSPDGLAWIFRLRQEGRWSNGEPVTADDFVASYRRALDPATQGPKADLFFGVKNAREYATGQIADFTTVGFHATDSHTLVVTLARPAPDFLAYAASGTWIPVNPRTVAAQGRNWTRPGNYVGNGPFVLTEWRPGQIIVVRKNPNFREASNVRLNEIQFVRFDDGDTEERILRAGQIDATMAVPFSKIESYARERPAELRHGALAETRYLAFNTRRAPLGDRRVRQALSLAIDRVRITTDVLRGGQEAAERLLPPGVRPPGDLPSDSLPGPLTLLRSAEESQRLLAEAGFPNGKNFPKLELSGWSLGSRPVLEAVQEMWKKTLGIEVAITIREARAHVAALQSGHYDVGFVTLIPDVNDPLAALQRFVSTSPENYPHWNDDAFDQVVAAAEWESDPFRRAELERAAEARLLREQPLAPVYFNARNWLMRPAVLGWQEDALWTRDYIGLFMEQHAHP